MTAVPPLSPALHDLVRWQGVRWVVTRVLPRGRLELSAVRDPLVQGLCLDAQLRWQPKDGAWILTGGV